VIRRESVQDILEYKFVDELGRMLDQVPVEAVDVQWGEFMQEEPSMVRMELACANVTSLRKRHTSQMVNLAKLGNMTEVVCPISTCVIPGSMCQEVTEHRQIESKDSHQCVCSAVSLSKKVRRKVKKEKKADAKIQKLAESKQKVKKV